MKDQVIWKYEHSNAKQHGSVRALILHHPLMRSSHSIPRMYVYIFCTELYAVGEIMSMHTNVIYVDMDFQVHIQTCTHTYTYATRTNLFLLGTWRHLLQVDSHWERPGQPAIQRVGQIPEQVNIVRQTVVGIRRIRTWNIYILSPNSLHTLSLSKRRSRSCSYISAGGSGSAGHMASPFLKDSSHFLSIATPIGSQTTNRY